MVDVILKDKKIDFPEDYYKVSHFPQKAEKIQENKKEEVIKNYLETALDFYSKDIKSTRGQQKMKKRGSILRLWELAIA